MMQNEEWVRIIALNEEWVTANVAMLNLGSTSVHESMHFFLNSSGSWSNVHWEKECFIPREVDVCDLWPHISFHGVKEIKESHSVMSNLKWRNKLHPSFYTFKNTSFYLLYFCGISFPPNQLKSRCHKSLLLHFGCIRRT